MNATIVSALATLLGSDKATFNAGRGDSRLCFTKPLASFSESQAKKALTYGLQQVFNDYRSPLLAKVKSGEQTLPQGVAAGNTEALFDYWWANIFGQERTRASSGPTGTPVEKQAIQEYLASRPTAFGLLYATKWVDPKELTPKGKAKAKARPGNIEGLKECLTCIAGGSLSPEKWATVQNDIETRKAQITKARKIAEANAKDETTDLEALF